MKRAAEAVGLMHLLPQLHDPHSELLLLRSCMGIAKLFFGLRTCQPVHMEEAALCFDKGLRGSIEDIMVCRGPFFGDWLRYQLGLVVWVVLNSRGFLLCFCGLTSSIVGVTIPHLTK